MQVREMFQANVVMTVSFRIRETPSRRVGSHRRGFCVNTCIAALLSVACVAQGPSSAPTTGAGYHPERDTSVTAVNQRPDANRVQEINTKRMQTQRFAAANAERKRQLDEDSARLLRLTAELNAELGKTGEAEVPLTAAARVDMIEKLAHAVKDKMKLTMSAP
jgi:hypothetical protein